MGPRGRFYPYLYHCDCIGLLGTGFMQVFHFTTKNNQITDQITDLKNWSVITDQITTI